MGKLAQGIKNLWETNQKIKTPIPSVLRLKVIQSLPSSQSLRFRQGGLHPQTQDKGPNIGTVILGRTRPTVMVQRQRDTSWTNKSQHWSTMEIVGAGTLFSSPGRGKLMGGGKSEASGGHDPQRGEYGREGPQHVRKCSQEMRETCF